jgi:RNA polymerase sigma factor (sigma-70 family)
MNAMLTRLTRLAVDLAHEGDSRLIDRFLSGSETAFRELVTRHGALVYGVCQRILRHRQDAEDAFQAVFLVLARRAADVWPRDAVGSWLYGVASRVALKARLHRARRVAREHSLIEVADHRAPCAEPDLAESVDRVVRRLPEIYRAAVIACDLEGLSRKDAAGQLGWSEGTLSGRLARARKLLADRLRRAGLALPAGGLATVLGTDRPVRAALEENVVRLISAGADSVPAPVVALTEGVAPSMITAHVKSLVAAAVVVCTIGLGAWAGAGDGQAGGGRPAATTPVAAQSTPALPKAASPAAPRKVPTELELLQGRWRITSMTENGIAQGILKDGPGEITIKGTALTMPYREADGGQKQLEYRIAVDDSKQPRTIDLISPRKPVGRGIYEFIAPQTVCYTCHDLGQQTHWKDRKALEFWLLKGTDFHIICQPGNRLASGLRLALAVEGERPTKFEGDKVVVFTLERIGGGSPADEEKRRAMELAWLRAFGAIGPEGELLTARLRLEEARAVLETARAKCDQAQAHVEQANQEFTLASRNLQAAQAKLNAAEKAAATAGQKQRGAPVTVDESFAIHVRPLTAPEKIIRVKATGKETVLEGLAHAAEDMAIKADAFSAWVVRGKEIMPVDLVGIIQKGETTTNYVLKAGDQLFVQTRGAK